MEPITHCARQQVDLPKSEPPGPDGHPWYKMSTMMSAIKAVGSDNVGFNPFAFKRSFSATVIYSASALYFVKMAMESFWSDYTVYQITDPMSITIIMNLTPALSLLRYLSVLALFFGRSGPHPLSQKSSLFNEKRSPPIICGFVCCVYFCSLNSRFRRHRCKN